MKDVLKLGCGCIAILVIVLIITLLAGNNWYQSQINNPPSDSEETVEVTIETGASFTSLLDNFEEQGIINSKLSTLLYLKLEDITPNIKAGTYDIPKNLTIDDLIAMLDEGVYKPGTTFTVPEGYRYEQIADLIERNINEFELENSFDKKEFLKIAKSPDKYSFSKKVQPFLDENKPKNKPLRGFLFPDTYQINEDTTSQQIIEMMILNLKKRLEENEVNTKNLNLYRKITLASIVEKEASKSDNKNLIAGIFQNRLNTSYPLESCATVNFVTGKEEILITDTQINSPYNTYKKTGLTPTPINNPGMKSILGAINPKKTDYIFFYHDSKGKTHFAKNYNQHQINIANNP